MENNEGRWKRGLRVIAGGGAPGEEPAAEPQESAIEVHDAVLQYPIGPTRSSLKTGMMSLFGHKDATQRTTFVDALKSLNLSVAHGDRIGIIGVNGAGKSTLLKALSGIYPLKSGSIRITGKIGTLLDPTLGFEVESTGRENIYYRGIALGYSPAALKEVEQEIIDFADIGEFIDLPMRTYSQGMFVRLGFSISTQFSPDVLLVDEGFGAADAQFAIKAVDRMQRMVKRAGIVMLATHDLALISNICSRVLWLNKGLLLRDGPPQTVLPLFMQYVQGQITLEQLQQQQP